MKTVELIVEEVDWEPQEDRIASDSMVGIHIGLKEKELQDKVKKTGGRWDRKRQVWDIRYEKVLELGLKDRIIEKTRI